jgi:hypothetical protein
MREEPSISSNHEKHTKVDVFDINPPLSPIQEKKLLKLLRKDVKNRIKYDFKHVALFIPAIRLFLGEDRNANDKKVFCSEEIIQRLKDVGCILLNAKPYLISPGELAYSPLLKYNKTIITD